MMYVALALVSQAGAGLGLMISASAENIVQATSIAPLFIMPLTLFGGLLVNTSTTPAWLSWI